MNYNSLTYNNIKQTSLICDNVRVVFMGHECMCTLNTDDAILLVENSNDLQMLNELSDAMRNMDLKRNISKAMIVVVSGLCIM